MANLCVRCFELFVYHLQSVILKRVVPAEFIVAGAGRCHGVLADLMSIRHSLAPAIEMLFNLVSLKEKRRLDSMFAEQRQTCIDLADTPVVKTHAERHPFSVWPLKGASRFFVRATCVSREQLHAAQSQRGEIGRSQQEHDRSSGEPLGNPSELLLEMSASPPSGQR